MSARIRSAVLAACLSASVAASADSLLRPVDNCATFLGSVSKELRWARAQAPGQRTSFRCPRERESRVAIGADGERIRRVLGTPDLESTSDDGARQWSYLFVSRLRDPSSTTGGGFPELTFEFDDAQRVRAVVCNLSR